MYRDSAPRYGSNTTEDYESLWFRLQGELARRKTWGQEEIAALMERLEDEGRLLESVGLDPATGDYEDE
jgi:hypothetical protein